MIQLILNVDDNGNVVVIFPDSKQLTYDYDTYFGEAVNEIIEDDWNSD